MSDERKRNPRLAFELEMAQRDFDAACRRLRDAQAVVVETEAEWEVALTELKAARITAGEQTDDL